MLRRILLTLLLAGWLLRGGDHRAGHGGGFDRHDCVGSRPLGRVLLEGAALPEGLRSRSRRRGLRASAKVSSGCGCGSRGMRLGDEFIELTEYLAPQGRPAPADSRSNDRWFQHVAIIVSDMDRAYAWLRRTQGAARVARSAAPAGLEQECRRHPGVLFPRPRRPLLEILRFPPDKGNPKWHAERTSCFSE